jgi:hypothetical protein
MSETKSPSRAFLFRKGLGFENNLNASILTGSSRLLLVDVIDFCLLCDSLTVRHLWSTNVGFRTVLTLHTVDNDFKAFKVKLSHTLKNSLTGFLVTGETE